MKNKKLHCRNRYPNPFGGEERLLFKDEKKDEEVVAQLDIIPMLSVDKLQTNDPRSAEVKTLMKGYSFMIDGVMNNDPTREKLGKEMRGVQNSIEILQAYKNKLDTESVDLMQFAFIGKANKILFEVKKLEKFTTTDELGRVKFTNPVGNIASGNDYENAADQTAKSAIYNQVRQEIDVILQNMIRDLESQKQIFEEEMKAYLLDDLEKIISNEKDQWDGVPTEKGPTSDPKVPLQKVLTKASYESFMEGLEKNKAAVEEWRKDPSKVKSSEILEVRQRFEDTYTAKRKNLQELSSNDFNLDDITDRVKKLQESLHKGNVADILHHIPHQVDTALAELANAEHALEEHKEEKFLSENDYKGYKEHKENLDKIREQLNFNREIQKHSENLLNDAKFLFEENPIDGSKMPTGLMNQIEFVKQMKDPLTKKMYTKALHEAVSKAESMVSAENFETYHKKDLPQKTEKLKDYTKQFTAPKGNTSKKKIHWVTWYDLGRGYEIIKSWAENRMHRNSDARIGDVGSNVLGNLKIPLTETLVGEFSNKVHEAEHHEVDRLAGLLKPHDIFHIRHMMESEVSHEDQLKAIINVLCEKGAMRWDDVNLLKLLNKFQKRIIFDTTNGGENEFKDQAKFAGRLREATTAIWTPDDYRNWESQRSSAYESGKQKFESKCNELAETVGLKSVLKDMLKEVRMKGPHGHKVDAMEYEQIIHYAIAKGKMAPHHRLYYIIQGIDTGLLERKRGSELDSKFLNDYPPVEFFSGGASIPYGYVKALARIDADQFEPGVAYGHHFQSEVMNIKQVRERLEKTVTAGSPKLDHDDFISYGAYLDDRTMETLLKQRSDGSPLPVTGYINITASMLNYLDMLSFSYDDMEDNERELSRFLSVFMNFDNITRGRKYAGRPSDYFKWGSTGTDTREPRAAGSFYRGAEYSKTARGYIDKVKGLIKEFDPVFFEFIYQDKIPSNEEVEKFANDLQTKYPGQAIFGDQQIPKTYDALLDVAGAYLKFVVSSDKKKVRAILAKVKEDQKKDGVGQSVAAFAEAMEKSKKRVKKKEDENAGVGHGGHGHGHGHAPKEKWDEDPWDHEEYMLHGH